MTPSQTQSGVSPAEDGGGRVSSGVGPGALRRAAPRGATGAGATLLPGLRPAAPPRPRRPPAPLTRGTAGSLAARALVALVALGACTAPGPLDTDPRANPPVDDTGGADTAPALPRPLLQSPAEAVDLDASAGMFHVELRAAPHTYDVDGAAVDGFAYNGQVPGPTLRVQVGDTLTAILQNDLADATTVHWHGLRVPEAMDGAGWVDGGVLAGTAFTYTFTPSSPGTFWYHPHLDVGAQVDGGLYGALIVEDPAEPAADRELLLVFDAWGEHDPDDVDLGAGDDHHRLTDPESTVWTVNGLVDPRFVATAGERIRVRTLNASNTGYLALSWPGMRLLATDQGLLGAPESPEIVVLAPGDRAELEWDVAEGFDVTTLPWVASGGAAYGDPRRLLSVEVDTPGAAPTPLDWPAADTTPSADPPYTDLVYVFQGGGAGDWLINGEAWPAVTTHTAALDADTVIEVRNLSATNHPFHLHGQRFEVLSIDGVPVPARRVEDTVDVGIRETVRLLLHADNPGDWLLHCHLLGHEEGGMMTVLRVE